ncbi:flavin-containing monooxygenase [Aeromicrobium sp.]|uniref:flavin-containing monooxygenase n=1 Tax=Aeromicrobium sp. TaxID=1871063 RepID=UPI0040348FDD
MEHVDVVIVGAGLSGIGAAHRLSTMSPGSSFTILEARDAMGGTWDLFRYPGVRSDSDMYTLSYPFRPWTDRKSIADGGDIRAYIRSTADEHGIARRIRYGHRVVAASWSSADARWTLTSEVDGELVEQTCSFLFMCSGYYDYDEAYTPDFPGLEDFAGTVVHPQFWPEDLDYRGKKVVVIGSGATAITLLPSMAEEAEHVTMLQRSPTYITSLPGEDAVSAGLRKVLPAGLAHRVTRVKNATVAIGFYEFCRRFPSAAKKILLTRAGRSAPDGFDPKHLTPRYDPWDQRLCVVPNGDLWRTLRRGKASIVTDHIDGFDETGIRLTSGQHLDADVVVTATGLKVVALGKVAIDVDGEKVDPNERFVYKGLMISGVPNLAWCIGYTNASWTLRADLSWQYVARLVEHMRSHGYAAGTPDPQGAKGETAPALDLQSGYVQRAAGVLPQQGREKPWTVRQNWFLDAWDNRRTDLDEAMVWTRLDETSRQSAQAS